LRAVAIISILFVFVSRTFSQDTTKVNVGFIVSAINKASSELAIERIYLHTDRSTYAAGDTLWFKAYLFEARYLNASTRSGVIYLEIVNDSNEVLKRVMAPVYFGLGFGQFDLDRKDMPPGNYTLRAYTNWMRNFGEKYICVTQFSITGTRVNDWMVNYSSNTKKENDKESINLHMKINQLDSIPVQLRTLNLRVTDKKRVLFRDEVRTGSDGTIDFQFSLPEKTKTDNISITLRDASKQDQANDLVVPLQLNRPENIDLQFMPEGGNLVAGLPARVVFKALNEDGLAANVSGTIVDSNAKAIVNFRSSHAGIGQFTFFPVPGETYSAVMDLPGGLHKTYSLPTIQSAGITLQVENELNEDSCEVIIRATPDILNSNKSYLLLAQARSIICYGASFKLKNGVAKMAIPRQAFPQGIVQFTLSGKDNLILNERKIFIEQQDQLSIQITPHKTSYGPRDSVAFEIFVRNRDGQPVQGSFSMAVTDDSQVHPDSTRRNSMLSQLLLTGELQGNIEDPGYYLPSALQNAERWRELDMLMLAQGWVGYEWNEMEALSQHLVFPSEAEFAIRGKVTNAFNKPVAGSRVTLLAKRPFLITNTITNQKGEFKFSNIIPDDTAVYFLQSVNKKEKKFNVGIEMEEFRPPVFTASRQRIIPWYVNIDTTQLISISNQIRIKKEMERVTGIKVLEEVIVTAKKVVRDSKNLNGAGEADLVIGEEELKKAGRTTLGGLLTQRVNGFGVRTTKTGSRFYAINTMAVHLIIDGINIEFFKPEGTGLYDYFKQYFDYYDAGEIKGIEVMRNLRYSGRYASSFLDPLASPFDHAFVEVTTRGGVGPFLKKEIGTYLYRPLPFNIPRKFYVPKYTAASIPDKSDIRSTIFWEPDIITNKEGRATVSFYTADLAGKYTVIMEGSDMQGGIGSKRIGVMVLK
jgi:hypothetical protein